MLIEHLLIGELGAHYQTLSNCGMCVCLKQKVEDTCVCVLAVQVIVCLILSPKATRYQCCNIGTAFFKRVASSNLASVK